ncbi:MAG: hypothetical protein SH868_19535 [Bythopirellula sp.]|nr:hypothetical protein [Bythopirellula sp.]
MMRNLLEYLTQRSVDNGTPPPVWLRWLQERDPMLREYASDALELDDLLRVSASARRSELAREPLTSRPVQHVVRRDVTNPSRYAQWGWLATTAAALLAFVIFWNHDPEKQANAARAQMLSTQLATMPDDMLAALAQAARSSQDYSPLARLKLPPGSLWSDIPRETQGQLKESLNEWGTQLSALGEQVYEQLDVRAGIN